MPNQLGLESIRKHALEGGQLELLAKCFAEQAAGGDPEAARSVPGKRLSPDPAGRQRALLRPQRTLPGGDCSSRGDVSIPRGQPARLGSRLESRPAAQGGPGWDDRVTQGIAGSGDSRSPSLWDLDPLGAPTSLLAPDLLHQTLAASPALPPPRGLPWSWGSGERSQLGMNSASPLPRSPAQDGTAHNRPQG